MRMIRPMSRWAVPCLTLLALACVTAGRSSAQPSTSSTGESQPPITLRADKLIIKESPGEQAYEYAYCIFVPMRRGAPRTQAEALFRQLAEAGEGPKATGAFWRVGVTQTDPPIVYALTTFNQGTALNDALGAATGRAPVSPQPGRQTRIVTKAATFVPATATLTLEGGDESPTTLEGPDAAYRLGGRKVEVVLGKGALRITAGSVEQVKPAQTPASAASGAKAPAATPTTAEERTLRVFYLGHITPADARTRLTDPGGPLAGVSLDVVSLSERHRENALVVSGPAPLVGQVAQFLEQIDRPGEGTIVSRSPLKHLTPLHAKALLESADGPLSGGRLGTVEACGGGGSVRITASAPLVVEKVRRFLEEIDVPQPDPLPPDQVLERYLESWIIPCDDRDPSSAPDYKAMYAVTTKAGQAQISYEEFRELIGSALQTETQTTYNQFGQASTVYTTEGPTSILHVYEPDIRGDAAYVWYTLRVEKSARTVGYDKDGKPIPERPVFAPGMPVVAPNRYVVPPAAKGGEPADPAPAGAEPKPAQAPPAQGNYGGGGFGGGGFGGGGFGGMGGYGGGGFGGVGSFYGGGYGGGGSMGGGLPAREGNIERNQAVLVKEDGQWRLPMRFDPQVRRWYLPLSTDPRYFSPAGEPAGLEAGQTSAGVFETTPYGTQAMYGGFFMPLSTQFDFRGTLVEDVLAAFHRQWPAFRYELDPACNCPVTLSLTVAADERQFQGLSAGPRPEQVAEAEAKVREAQAALDLATTEEKAATARVEAGIATADEKARAAAQLATAKARLTTAQAQLDLLRRSPGRAGAEQGEAKATVGQGAAEPASAEAGAERVEGQIMLTYETGENARIQTTRPIAGTGPAAILQALEDTVLPAIADMANGATIDRTADGVYHIIPKGRY